MAVAESDETSFTFTFVSALTLGNWVYAIDHFDQQSMTSPEDQAEDIEDVIPVMQFCALIQSPVHFFTSPN